MGYLLVKPEILENKGIKYYETLPDGRAIADFSMLKVLGSIESVEIIATTNELHKIAKMQTLSGLYDKPVPEENAGDAETIDPGIENNGENSDDTVITGPSEEQQSFPGEGEPSIQNEGDSVGDMKPEAEGEQVPTEGAVQNADTPSDEGSVDGIQTDGEVAKLKATENKKEGGKK